MSGVVPTVVSKSLINPCHHRLADPLSTPASLCFSESRASRVRSILDVYWRPTQDSPVEDLAKQGVIM